MQTKFHFVKAFLLAGIASSLSCLPITMAHARSAQAIISSDLTAEQIASIQQSADRGDLQAMLYIGLIYSSGYGVPENDLKGLTYLKKAASMSETNFSIQAAYFLAGMYEYGKGTKVDLDEALKWYMRASDHQDVDATISAAKIYRFEEGRFKQPRKAKALFEKAVRMGNGDGEAERQMGLLYEDGFGVSKDYRKALDWYRKSADKGNPTGKYNLGLLYLNGLGTDKNVPEAIKLIQAAADSGDQWAQYKLGGVYNDGDSVPADYVKARQYYEKAAAQGDLDATRAIGYLYVYGQGVSQDLVKFRSIADSVYQQKEDSGVQDLAWCNDVGIGGPVDKQKARELYMRSGDLGNDIGYASVADQYYFGDATQVDLHAAQKFYRRATKIGLDLKQYRNDLIKYNKLLAETGQPGGQYWMGLIYQRGIEGLLKADPAIAAQWMEKAAAQGYPYAKSKLGEFYEKGFGVPSDMKKAVELYEQSQDLYGNEWVKQRLKAIKQN